jgi:hypothetical protein
MMAMEGEDKMRQQRFTTLLLSVSVALIVGIIIVGFNWENMMGSNLPGDPNHRLPRTLISQLFDRAPSPTDIEGGEEIYVSCTAMEGNFCYFVPPALVAEFDFSYKPEINNAANEVERTLANELLRQLDVKHVERAKNNTVLLHCQRHQDETLSCTINGGNENWYPVELT